MNIILKLTEKQFANIWNLTGEEDLQEKEVGAKALIMI